VVKWPELASPPSPPLSPDESDGDGGSGGGSASGTRPRPRSISGFPGATKLKHTQTILGPSRTGALGMGVGGRRRSDAKRFSSQTLSPESASGDGETTVASTSTSYMTATSSTTVTTVTSKSPPRQEQQQQQQQQVSTATDAPPLKPVFVPKFKGAAEMDERRRLRLQARRGVAAAAAAAADAATSSTPEIRIVTAQEKSATLESSGDEEEVEEEDSFLRVEDEDFDDVVDVGVSVDIDEVEFDPCVFFLCFF
jgi:target of rapamycin complex 2 subunit MAPKAP1